MKINEITTKLGISRKAILYYETEGLITSTRELNNYRNFDQTQIEKLKVIYKLRLADVPVSVIKQYLATADNSILENYIIIKQKQLESEMAKISSLQIDSLEDDYIEPIKAIDYIAENISGPFGRYISSHFRYYFEKDSVTYQGNELVFKQMIQYIESKDWTGVNDALTKYPEVELPASIHNHTYKYVVNLKQLPSEPKAAIQSVSENVKLIKNELESVDYYTKFIPMIKAVSPTYNLYTQKIEWLELKAQDDN